MNLILLSQYCSEDHKKNNDYCRKELYSVVEINIAVEVNIMTPTTINAGPVTAIGMAVIIGEKNNERPRARLLAERKTCTRSAFHASL